MHSLRYLNINNKVLGEIVKIGYKGPIQQEKPNIRLEDYNMISAPLKKELNAFCKKYHYDSILKEDNTHETIDIHNYKMLIPKSNDAISTGLMENKIIEEKVTNLLLNSIERIGIETFIEIGAYIGYYTLLIASKGIKTYSFEPNLHSYNLLKSNIELNDIKCAEIFNKGLGEKNATLTYNYCMSNKPKGTYVTRKSEPNNIKEEHIVEALDNINIEGGEIAIKIDTVGWELPVLKGMKKLFQSKRIKMIILEMRPFLLGKAAEENIITILKSYFARINVVHLEKEYTADHNMQFFHLFCT